MQTTQLSIFSWQTDKIAEASKYLGKLDFDNAIVTFREVLQKHPENTIAQSSLQMANFWHDVFQQSGSPNTQERIKHLYEQIIGYSFDKNYQSQILKKALLNYLIVAINKQNLFFLSKNICIADVYVELNKYEKAEFVLKKYLKTHQHSALIHCRLADILWMQGLIKEANKNYAIALLTSPGEFSNCKIENKELHNIIRDNGVKMAPAYGWLSRILPLIDIEKLNFKKCKTADSKALDIYHTLFLAEKNRKQSNNKHMVAYRKKLKEIAPEFYDKYYKWLSLLNEIKFTYKTPTDKITKA